jgi:GT2 family glycosyltransferase
MDRSGKGGGTGSSVPISVVVPTYERESVLVATIEGLIALKPSPTEILIVDQTEKHSIPIENVLREWEKSGVVKLIRLSQPSIPRAMNVGLCEASQELVLFVDDDIVPEANLIDRHLSAFERSGAALIAGRVIQPWHEGKDPSELQALRLASVEPGWTSEFMGCNFAVRREIAIMLGGFDEQFVSVAYHFEAEFVHRMRNNGHKIFYEPEACIHHLKVAVGGTRAFGDHLRTSRPNHTVGAYYFILRTWSGWRSLIRLLGRPLRSVSTRHHVRRPWWIPVTLAAEISGMVWALALAAQGPRYLSNQRKMPD